MRQGQPGWELALPTSMPTVVDPTTTEVPTQPTYKAPLDYIALVTRGEYVAGPHRTSPT